MSSFSEETSIKAVRKARPCCGCGKMVEVGQPAIRWAGVVDGDFSAVTYHPECRAAEIGLNEVNGGGWGEWWGLIDAERDDYPYLLAEHPIAAARLGITPKT